MRLEKKDTRTQNIINYSKSNCSLFCIQHKKKDINFYCNCMFLYNNFFYHHPYQVHSADNSCTNPFGIFFSITIHCHCCCTLKIIFFFFLHFNINIAMVWCYFHSFPQHNMLLFVSEQYKHCAFWRTKSIKCWILGKQYFYFTCGLAQQSDFPFKKCKKYH
jgi:hypothetical protein